MSKTRRYFTAEQKAEIVRRHLAGKEAVSDLADEFGVQPSLIHNWVNQVLAQAERAFDRPSGKRRKEETEARKIAFLEAKLANKNEVIAELMQEHVQLKKELGDLWRSIPVRDRGSSATTARSRGTRYSGSARDFKEFIRLLGMTHVRTSPYYPQSNGKLERWHGSVKRECIRPAAPASLEEARRRVGDYVEHYNHVRLNSAIGYLTPADKLNGLDQAIFAERDRKLEEARQRRQQARQAAREVA